MAATSTRSRGQATVEFALSVTVFLTLVCGVFDLGRGVYQNNGLSEAAREIARVTSVHPGSPLGSSTETAAVIATQKSLIPNLHDPSFSCQDIDGSAVSGTCQPGDWVKVTIHAPFTPATPLIGLVGSIDFQSSSSIQIP